MNRITDELIQEINNKANILDIVSNYVSLRKHGKNYFGICPFHDDHSPSMSVNEERQMFKCFTCGVGGNVFTFVSKYENIGFFDAVKRVGEMVGVSVDTSGMKKKDDKYQSDYEIMDFASKIFQNNLNSSLGIDARKYLESRSFSEETIKDFGIGFSIKDNKGLYNLISKKYKNKDLFDLGLIYIDGNTGLDVFVNRVMIPIKDHNNNIVGFTGRVIKEKYSGGKYINTKETRIYTKGNILFNYCNSKDYIREKKEAILVEGNMDAIRMYSSGIRNVIALMGTSMTKFQIKLLKNLHAPIVLMLDNDNAGFDATVKIGELLLNENVDVYVVRLNGAKDPDEYIVNFGVEELENTIKHKISFLEFKLTSLKVNFNLDNPIELSNYVNNVIEFLKDKDNITKEVVIKKISEDYNLDYEVLKSELKINEIKENKPAVKEVTIKKSDKYKECVDKIFSYIMSDIKYLTIFNNRVGYFKEKRERELYNEVIYYARKNKKVDIAGMTSFVSQFPEYNEMMNDIMKDIDFDNMNEDLFMEYLNYFDKYLKQEHIKDIKKKIKEEIDINRKVELINELTKLKKEV